MQGIIQRLSNTQRVKGYSSNQSPEWQLLSDILKMWISQSKTPVLLLPIPMHMFIERSSDALAYQTRFQELANATGCYLHDPLTDLCGYSQNERLGFFHKHNNHLTPSGHDAVAHSLAPVIKRIKIECCSVRYGAAS